MVVGDIAALDRVCDCLGFMVMVMFVEGVRGLIGLNKEGEK